MMHSELYEPNEHEVAQLLAAVPLGRLVTVGRDGLPYIGLYPFLRVDVETIEIHLNGRDEQIAHLRERPVCAFEVDQVLSSIPSSWLDDENAVYATAYHRSVQFGCRAELTDDPARVAAQQRRLMASHQPTGTYRAVDHDDPMYRAMIGALVGVTLTITSTRTKFKLAQNRSPEQRRTIVANLRTRADGTDLATADAIEATLATGV